MINPIVFITGASSGFGKAIAEKFAAAKYSCIITGRREVQLKKLAQELEQKYQVSVLPLVFDVQHREEVFEIFKQIPTLWQDIVVLVNNAGLSLGRDSLEKGSVDDWDTMIDTNIKGLLYVSKAVIPYMTQRRQGHIINIGSIAGKEVYQNGNVYCATKAAVDALSASMRIDLLSYGIKVTAIHPGAAETEFSLVRFKGNVEAAQQVYQGYTPLSAQDIADVVYYCATVPPHVCINDLVVTCTAQASPHYLHRNIL